VCAAPATSKKAASRARRRSRQTHIVAASPVSPSVDWKFANGKKTTIVKLTPRLAVTSNEAAIRAQCRDSGWLTSLVAYQIARSCLGQLKAVLSDYEPPRLPIHVLHSEGRQASAKVRISLICW